MCRFAVLKNSGILTCLVVAFAVIAQLAGCGQLVSDDFRIRLWERFSANGHRAMSQQDYKTAALMFQNASEESSAFAKNDLRTLQTLADLGWARVQAGQYEGAAQPLTEALARCEKTLPEAPAGDKEALCLVMTRSLVGLGEVARVSHQERKAEELYRKAISTFDNSGINVDRGYDSIGTVLTIACRELATIRMMNGDREGARNALSEAASISDITIGAMKLKAETRTRFVELVFYQGDIEKGVKLSNRLWGRMIRDGVRAMNAFDWSEARDHFNDALQIAGTESGDSTILAVSYWYLANLSAQQGNLAEARQYSREGLALRQEQKVDSDDFLTKQFNTFLN